MKKKNNTLASFVADDNAREISRIHYQFEDLRHNMLHRGLNDAEFYISVAYLLFTRDVDKKIKTVEPLIYLKYERNKGIISNRKSRVLLFSAFISS